MSQFPKTVKIGARTFPIHRVPSIDLISRDRAAEIDFRLGAINIMEDTADDAAATFLIHEILHGIFTDAGLDIENEEALVMALTPRLAALVIDNPSLFPSLLTLLSTTV